MKKDLENNFNDFEKFFLEEPDAEEKAWGVLHDFYHYLLTWMEDHEITKADLAKTLGKSRAAVTKMFRTTPNISIKKIVEITHALGINVNLKIEQVPEFLGEERYECVYSWEEELFADPLGLVTVEDSGLNIGRVIFKTSENKNIGELPLLESIKQNQIDVAYS